MNKEEFFEGMQYLIKHATDYIENNASKRVIPDVEPGFLREKIPLTAPVEPDKFADVMRDFEKAVLPGMVHWTHKDFFAYFPNNTSYAGMLGEVLCTTYNVLGFSWAASPALTELELMVLDMFAKMIALPGRFLNSSGTGGGCFQSCASECVFLGILAAKNEKLKALKMRGPQIPHGIHVSKLVVYCSKLAHSCVVKACKLACVRVRELEVDEDYCLRGSTLIEAIKYDKGVNLVPFIVVATMGTTSVCSFDNLVEISQVCKENDIWLHVDGAYAGGAMVLEENQEYLQDSVKDQMDSFNFNANHGMCIPIEAACFYIKSTNILEDCMTVDPLYLQHQHSNNVKDIRHWGIALSRRFRALKCWFVIRIHGVEYFKGYWKRCTQLALRMNARISQDPYFEIVGAPNLGLVCFRLKGTNYRTQMLLRALNMTGRIFLVPGVISNNFFIRFCVGYYRQTEEDIDRAYELINKCAVEILRYSEQNEEETKHVKERRDTYASTPAGLTDDMVLPSDQKLFLFDCNIPSTPTLPPEKYAPGDEIEHYRRKSIMQATMVDPLCFHGPTLDKIADQNKKT